MRLIDADELKNEILKEGNYQSNEKLEDYLIDFETLFRLIDNAPTVEPEKVLVANVTFDEDKLKEIVQTEVIEKIKSGELVLKTEERPQGEWIDYDNTFYKCPDCGYLLEKCCPQCQNKVILPKGGAE